MRIHCSYVTLLIFIIILFFGVERLPMVYFSFFFNLDKSALGVNWYLSILIALLPFYFPSTQKKMNRWKSIHWTHVVFHSFSMNIMYLLYYHEIKMILSINNFLIQVIKGYDGVVYAFQFNLFTHLCMNLSFSNVLTALICLTLSVSVVLDLWRCVALWRAEEYFI